MILYLDPRFVVADKPPGLPTVPGRPAELHDCLWHRVREQVPDALVVHRLDMATSGLVLFARGPSAQRALAEQFARRRVDKRYVAIAAGLPAADAGTIELPLAADWPNRPRQKSRTEWRVIARDAARGWVRLELRPLTGRTHQLRVHLAAIGHPLFGDTLYAPPEIASAAPRLLLHASGLRFAQPSGDGQVVFENAAPF